MKSWIGVVLAAGLAIPALAQHSTAPVLVAEVETKGALAKKLPMPRKDIERLLVGHHREQVAALLGDSARNSLNATAWVFSNVTVDEVSGKRDSQLYVYFDGKGKVTRLGY